LRRYIAEFLGTFSLILIGTGTAALTNADPLTISLAFGLTFAAMATIFQPFTDGQFNPAITLGQALNGKLPWTEALWVVLSQLIGAILASGLVRILALNLGNASNALGQTTSRLDWPVVLLTEGILTMILVLGFLILDDTDHPLAGLFNGILLAALTLVGYGLTGPALNPARALAPALYVGSDAIAQVWLYIVGPLLGAVVAAGINRFFRTTD
jgi:aquaporin Z